MAMNVRILTRILLVVGCCLLIGYYLRPSKQQKQSINDILTITSLGSTVNIIDPYMKLENDVKCIKTKLLLNLYNTTVCIHDGKDYVSTTLAQTHIWEEDYVTRLLKILIRNPHLDMIDIGANIGGYTMFTAGALGRFTLSVDCFMPNIERIIKAVQIQNVQNRVVLVQNALYAKSGELLRLSNGYPSGLQLTDNTQMDVDSHYNVKTIRFDDLLPILIERKVRAAIVKIDIEGSESYMCETGSKVFEVIDIQLVMMEWGHGLRKTYKSRYQSIIKFFAQLDYVVTDEKCNVLDSANWETTWPGNIYWIKRINFRNNIC
ncbi:unnamed protein product [Adineta steineri]|uniref:Methyltransferase FkbM domain-containing protein n=1 Tax=Adineta steineri TaxID=433720 RepID=A0A815P1Q3_9BILA|nr:unnamed protein product [Adineta steineri]CAF3620854.1 unnamed protein product [Adineta steineri]